MTLIVKNISNQSIMINDLGIEIQIDTQIELSNLFSFFDLMSSEDLKNLIIENKLIINNGICDLSIEDAIEYVTFEL
jgi:hypothetical protein